MDRINRRMKTAILKSTFVLQMLTSIAVVNAQPATITFVLQGETIKQNIVANMQTNASAVFSEINQAASENRNLVLSENNATKEAIADLHLIWATSHFHCLKPTYYQAINKTLQGYSVRNISVYFNAKNTLDNKNQDIAIHFDNNGKISNVFIATEQTQYEKLKEIGITPKELKERTLVLDFLEQFRTAYCRKDIVFIDTIFSPYALIITGYKITTMSPETRIPKSSTVYIEKDKKQYIDDLKKVFAGNKSLDIKFPSEKISITQHPDNKNLYAARCWQDWSSVKFDGSLGYADSGWLTLVIDFTGVVNFMGEIDSTEVVNSTKAMPKVWVRAWQDPNFRESELYKITYFNP